MTAPLNEPRTPPYKLAGLVLTLITIAAVVALVIGVIAGAGAAATVVALDDNNGPVAQQPGRRAGERPAGLVPSLAGRRCARPFRRGARHVVGRRGALG